MTLIVSLIDSKSTEEPDFSRNFAVKLYQQLNIMNMTNKMNEIESAELDKVMAATQKAGYIVIEGRPASGKSTLGLSLAKTVAMDNKQSVAFFSLEMNKNAVVNRLLALINSLPSSKIQNGDLTKEELERFDKNLISLSDSPLYIDDSTALTISQIRTRAHRLVDENGIKLFIIDYLQLMHDDSMQYASRQEEVTAISLSLGSLSKELNIPIIVFSQLSRDGNSPKLTECADKVFRIC